jgi:DNA polymerase
MAEPVAEPGQGADTTPAQAGAYQATLASAGYPLPILILDFETYYDRKFSLKKMPIPVYVHDRRFRAHGLALRWPGGRSEFRTDVDALLEELQRAYGPSLENATVVGHNLAFDAYILSRRHGIRPRFLVDTLALARHVHPGVGNSLRELAVRYGLPPKGDIENLSGIRELNPKQLAYLRAYAVHDANLTHDLFSRLLPRVSRPDVELEIAAHTLRLFTERGLVVAVEAAEQLEQELRQRVAAALTAAGIDRKTAGGDQFVSVLREEMARGGRALPTKRGAKGPIPALAKTDAGMLRLLKDENPRVAALARARLAVKSAPQFLRRVQTILAIARACDGNVPVPINYYGAHTGRFSGGGGLNLQNLAARVEGPAGRIRSLFQPRAGHRFVIIDFSQIEARVLAWLAEQEDLLRAFADGRDVYCEFASQIFGASVRKPTPSDPPEVREQLRARRQLGKIAVLGLGYQMGSAKFHTQLAADSVLADGFRNEVLSDSFAERIVHEYRRSYPYIPLLWKSAQDAFCRAIETGEAEIPHCRFHRESADIFVTLPSTRHLVYRDVEYSGSRELVYAGNKKLYGGKLVENIVQAIARDVLVEGILALEKNRLPVILHVHDEVVLQVPAETAETVREAAINILRAPPAWASRLPLAAEGAVTDRYGK